MKNRVIIRSILEIFIIVLVSYPLFYSAYKFSVPSTQGLNDYDAYYHLYSNWDYNKVPSPFNIRIISSYGTFLITKLGYAYDTKINFEGTDKDKVVFFSALLFNYLSLVFTCFLVYKTVLNKFKNRFFSFGIGLAYLFGFGTVFFAISPITDSLAGLFVAIILYCYLKKSYWIIVPLVLGIFQREYIFFIFGLLSTVKIIYDKSIKKNAYYVAVFTICSACFILYFILRMTLFYTSDYAQQIQVETYLSHLIHPNVQVISYIKQSFFNQNQLIIYFILIFYKFIGEKEINKLHLLNTLFLYLQTHIISTMVQLGNNAGRIFYFTTPIIIYYIAVELYPIVKSSYQLHNQMNNSNSKAVKLI